MRFRTRSLTTLLASFALVMLLAGTTAHAAPGLAACSVDNVYKVVWSQAGVYVDKTQNSYLIKTKSYGQRVTGPVGWYTESSPSNNYKWAKVWVNDPNYYYGWMRSGSLEKDGCA